MVKILNNLSQDNLDRAVNILKSLAHPMRLTIIRHLEKNKEMTVSQLHKLLDIKQSTTSHHLGILKDRGILACRRKGKYSFYYVKEKKLGEIIDCVTQCST